MKILGGRNLDTTLYLLPLLLTYAADQGDEKAFNEPFRVYQKIIPS